MSAACEQVQGAWREVPWIEPEAAFLAFSEKQPAFLDSRGTIGPRSRFSLLAWHPFRRLRGAEGRVWRDGVEMGGSGFAVLGEELAALRQPTARGPVPFPSVLAIGVFGYELASPYHPAPAHRRAAGLPDLAVDFHANLMAFDRARRLAWIACRDPAEADDARAWLRELPPSPPPSRLIWTADTPRPLHEARVRSTLARISAGDIYQANITARWSAPRPPGLRPADLYLTLAAASPAPFGAYVELGHGCAIASASPERLVRLSAGGDIEARPIKGTRRRAARPEADAALAAELRASAKDRAENLMIVDLLRHDIGRVAAIGSVAVPALCALESFAQVHHLVSAVTGTLRPALGPADVLAALHPGGSVTGAPKRRAMEIIAELEPCARGPYCGTLAWIGADGSMDASILIRTAILTPEAVHLHAGGGIVADSVPADEYAEMMIKAGPLLRALGRHDGA